MWHIYGSQGDSGFQVDAFEMFKVVSSSLGSGEGTIIYAEDGGGRFKLPWCEAGPPNHRDDEVDSDQ